MNLINPEDLGGGNSDDIQELRDLIKDIYIDVDNLVSRIKRLEIRAVLIEDDIRVMSYEIEK